MNLRIKELAIEARLITVDGITRYALDHEFEKRFAELIVAHATECVRDVLRDEESELTYGAADQVQKRIKQHFGVEL